MTGALAHRGPDDAGVAELRAAHGDACACFGHRRLSILDLSAAGHQPMSAADGRFTIVFNGEIYNFLELRAELSSQGIAFASDCDTEVILAGWAAWGRARLLPRLRGMFAFALWDTQVGRGYLVRDRYGIKPLYVAAAHGTVAFASEVRALLDAGVARPRIDLAAVAGYLAEGSVPEPRTIIDGVTSLPAGTVAEVRTEGGNATLGAPSRFAHALDASGAPAADGADAPARVRNALLDSVRHHLIADVPVGVFLSGGLDSSALAVLASRAQRDPIETFTVVLDAPGFDESAPARSVATLIGSRHHEVPLSGDDFLRALPDAFAAMDQPSQDGLNTYVVSRAVSAAGIKVVLSGLGGDELFAGYASFRRAARLAPFWVGTPRLRALAAGAARRLGGRLASRAATALSALDAATAAYAASRSLFSEPQVARLLGGSPPAGREALDAPDAMRGASLSARVSWLELNGYMRNTLLRDSDVFSMAHHLELRVPFLDPAVAGAALSAGDDEKLTPGRSKPLLVAALADLLPREVWDRPKQGFALPFEHWMRAELHAEVASVFAADERLRRVGLEPDAARQVWRDFLARRRGMSWSRPWALYTLVRWAEQVGVSTDVEAPSVPTSAPVTAWAASA